MNYITNSIIAPLKGEKTLRFVFWRYVVLLSIIVMIVRTLIMFYPLPFPTFITECMDWLSIAIGYSYTVWINASLWQCAFNTSSKITAYFTRFAVVCSILSSAFSLWFSLFGITVVSNLITSHENVGHLVQTYIAN